MPISLALPPVEFKNIINFSSEKSNSVLLNNYHEYLENKKKFEEKRDEYLNKNYASLTQKFTREKMNALADQAKKLEQKAADLDKFFQNQIDNNNKQSTSLNNALNSEKTSLNNTKDSINGNLDKANVSTKNIYPMIAGIGNKNSEIWSYTSKIEGANNSINGSKNDINNLKNDIRGDSDAARNVYRSIRTIFDVSPKGSELDTVLDRLNRRIDNMNEKINNIGTQVSNIGTEAIKIQKNVNEITNQMNYNDLNKASHSIKDAQDTLNKSNLNNLLTAQNNIGNNDGQKEAYTKAKEQIQTELNQLRTDLQAQIDKINASLSGTAAADVEEQLAIAKKNLKDSIAKFSANLQAALYLEKMQQKAFQTLRTENQTLSKLSSSFALNTSKLNFASKLSTNSRLAKLSNPKAKDLQFAQWIESIKHKHLADNATHLSNNTNTTSHQSNNSSNNINAGYLSKIIYDYDSLRFKHSHNVWGNIGTILGNSQGINSASGVVSVGYDTWIRNMILGIYGSYSYTSNAIANVDSTNSSHNGDIGVYGRIFGGNNEFDINLGENIGLNHLALKDSVGRETPITLEDNYMSLQTHLDLTYGYVFDLHKGWFSKPFLGVNYNYGYNSAMQAKDSVMSMGFNDFQTHFVSLNMGLEIRKYFNNNESYFFVAPAFYQGVLLSNNQVIETRIYDRVFSSSVSEFNKNSNLDTSFLLKVGGEWKIKENIYVNVSAGAKLGNINQYGMLNVGGRYSFGNADSNLSRALREKAKLDKAKAKQDKELKEKQEKAAKAKEKAAKEAKEKQEKQAKEAKEKLEKDNKAKEKAAKALKEKQEKAAKEAKAKADKQAKEAKEKQEKAAKEAKAKAEKDAKAKSSKGSSK